MYLPKSHGYRYEMSNCLFEAAYEKILERCHCAPGWVNQSSTTYLYFSYVQYETSQKNSSEFREKPIQSKAIFWRPFHIWDQFSSGPNYLRSALRKGPRAQEISEIMLLNSLIQEERNNWSFKLYGLWVMDYDMAEKLRHMPSIFAMQTKQWTTLAGRRVGSYESRAYRTWVRPKVRFFPRYGQVECYRIMDGPFAPLNRSLAPLPKLPSLIRRKSLFRWKLFCPCVCKMCLWPRKGFSRIDGGYLWW